MCTHTHIHINVRTIVHTSVTCLKITLIFSTIFLLYTAAFCKKKKGLNNIQSPSSFISCKYFYMTGTDFQRVNQFYTATSGQNPASSKVLLLCVLGHSERSTPQAQTHNLTATLNWELNTLAGGLKSPGWQSTTLHVSYIRCQERG